MQVAEGTEAPPEQLNGFPEIPRAVLGTQNDHISAVIPKRRHPFEIADSPSGVDDSFLEELTRASLVPIDLLSHLAKGTLRRFLLQASHDPVQSFKVQNIWKSLLATARSSAVGDKHLTATCNAICIFLHNTLLGPDAYDESIGPVEQVWFDSFTVVGRTFSEGKPKPSLQVLDVLVLVCKEIPDQLVANRIWTKVMHSLTEILVLGTPRGQVKEALVFTTRILRANSNPFLKFAELVALVIKDNKTSWTRRLKGFGIEPLISSSVSDVAVSSLALALFLARDIQESRCAAVKLFSTLLKLGGKEHMVDIRSSMELYITATNSNLHEFADDIFPTLFTDLQQFRAFISAYTGSMTVTQLSLILAMLQMGRSREYISEIDLPAAVGASLYGVSDFHSNDYSSFATLIRHLEPRIRIQAYTLLVWSLKTTPLVPTGALSCVVENLRYLHDEGDANYRGDILSTTSRLFIRLQGSVNSLQKCGGSEFALGEYRKLLFRLADFLVGELFQNVSYQRHIISLQTIFILFATKPSIELFGILQSYLIRSTSLLKTLRTLLLDPFEDVRETAMNILNEIRLSSNMRITRIGTIADSNLSEMIEDPNFIAKIESLASSTCRGDHSDGLGRIYGLSLKESGFDELSHRAEHFLIHTTEFELPTSFPLHGILLGLSYGLSHIAPTEESVHRLFKICDKVWALVQPHLCIDSPEFATEEGEDESSVGPKDLLAYSWRALRDSSLLLRAMLENLVVNEELYTRIGISCLEQLITLRHRGAFSTVARTFTSCCQALKSLPAAAGSVLRKTWYKTAMKQVVDQSTRLTRRSAGLPATITCILDPDDINSICEVVASLSEIALQPSQVSETSRSLIEEPSLPQVHALNCLREIMTNSRFRSVTERQILPLLEISATSFCADSWAIRNCGLMLFRACITRLERQRGGEVTMDRNSKSPHFCETDPVVVAVRLLQELSTASNPYRSSVKTGSEASPKIESIRNLDTKGPEVKFAALDLLKRCHLTEVVNGPVAELILNQLKSPIWAVREQAARLYASNIPHSEEISTVARLMSSLDSVSNPNRAHGTLLCCRNILHQVWVVTDPSGMNDILSGLCQMIKNLAPMASSKIRSAIARGEFIQICNDALEVQFNHRSGELMSTDVLFATASGVIEIDEEICVPPNQPAALLFKATALNDCFRVLLRSHDNPTQVTKSLCTIFTACAEIDTDAAKYLLNRLSELQWLEKHAIWTSFLCDVIHQHLQEDLIARVALMLSSCLATANCVVSADVLHSTGARLDAIEATSRDLSNAKLQLRAALLGRCSQFMGNGGSEEFRAAVFQWIFHLQMAANDETEEPTRLAAALSLSAYLSFLGGDMSLDSEPSHAKLDILVVLYKLLSDDDENIRSIASKTVSAMPIHVKSTPTNQLPIMSFAASEALIRYLNVQYSKDAHFGLLAIKKVLGVDGDLISYLHHNSVSTLMNTVAQNADSLFAEERQNLYIDSIHEVAVWSEALKDCEIASVHPHILPLLIKWIREGLETMEQFLDAEESSKKFPLGLTFSTEALLVFLKVIRLAGALRQYEEVNRTNTTSDVREEAYVKDLAGTKNLSKLLRSFEEAARKHDLHEQAFQALVWAQNQSSA